MLNLPNARFVLSYPHVVIVLRRKVAETLLCVVTVHEVLKSLIRVTYLIILR